MICRGDSAWGDGCHEFCHVFGARVLWFLAGKRLDAKTLDGFDVLLHVEIGNGFEAGNLSEAVFVDDTLHTVRKLGADAQLFADG